MYAMTVSVGITGSRTGPTMRQKEWLAEHFTVHRALIAEVHHGDCTGVDAAAHDLARAAMPSARIVTHPPESSSFRAFKVGDRALPPQPYAKRNEAIVKSAHYLIALPAGEEQQRGSGTWLTVRIARRQKTPHIIVMPDGVCKVIKPARVTNVRVSQIRPRYQDLKEWCADPQNVYVGRAGVVIIEGQRYPPEASPFANPYKVTESLPREATIDAYRTYITRRLRDEPALRQQLAQLGGKTLGCWCAPEKCHADVLAELIINPP